MDITTHHRPATRTRLADIDPHTDEARRADARITDIPAHGERTAGFNSALTHGPKD